MNNGFPHHDRSARKWLGITIASLLGSLVVLAAEPPAWLRFTPDFGDFKTLQGCQMELGKTAQVLPEKHGNGAVLRINGNGQDVNYGLWFKGLKVAPGKFCQLTVDVKMTKAFPPGNYAMVIGLFKGKDDEQVAGTKPHYLFLPKAEEWTGRTGRFSVPEGVDHIDLGIRIDAVPGTEALSCANLSLTELDDPYGGVPVIDFERLASQPRHDVTLIGPHAQLRTTTIGTMAAHAGEWYLEIEGANESSQCDLRLEDIMVKSGLTYNLSCFYRVSPEFPSRGLIVMITQFAGAAWNSEVLGSDYWYPLPTPRSGWTGVDHDIPIHPKAQTMAIRFRLESIMPGHKIWLDDLLVKRAEPTVFLEWSIDPAHARLTGTARPSRDISEKVKETRVVILQDRRVVKTRVLKGGAEEFSFDLRELTDDVPYYVTTVAFLNDGGVLTGKSHDVVMGRHEINVALDGKPVPMEVSDKHNLFYVYAKDRPWEGNDIGRLGKSDLPPKPWEPVAYDPKARRATTWNNEFGFGDGLGSMQVRFRQPEQALTEQPIALTLNGKPLNGVCKFAKVKTSYVSPNRVVLASPGQGPDLKIQMEIEVEFDGFVKCRTRIESASGKPFKVEQMALTLKFPKNYIQYSYNKDGLTFNQEWSSTEFNPIFWFGNYETGIMLCVERIWPSVRQQKQPWISLIRSGEQAVVSLNLVNQAVEVGPRPLIVEFGLQPTPARPFQAQLRNERFRSGEDSTLDVYGTMPCRALPYFGFPEITSIEAVRSSMNDRDIGKNVTHLLFYFGSNFAMETIPQMTYFKREWINAPANRYPTTDPSYKDFATGDYTTVDMGNPSWTDLCLFKLKEFVQRTGIKGTYNDTAYPLIKEKDGECSCPVFAGREFHKRVLVFLNQMFPNDVRSVYHQGLDTALPYAAFGDFVLNGEHFREQLMKHSYYLEFATLKEIRATVAAPFGPAHMFLSQYWQKEKASDKALMAQTAALAMIHDATMWVAGQEVLLKMMRQKYNFGDLQTAAWHPYWQDNPYLRTNNQEVVFSYYERNGDLFLILFNASRQKQKVSLAFQEEYRKRFSAVTSVRVYDPVDDRERPLGVKDNQIAFDLAPYGCQLVTCRR